MCCITWDAATNRYHLFFSRDVLSTYSQQFKGWSDEQFMQFLGKMVAPFTVHLKWIWHPAISFSMDWIFQREKKTTLHLSRKDETNDQQICWCHENYSHIPLYIYIPLFMVGDISRQHTPTINLSTLVDALHNIHVTFVKRLVLSNNIQSIKVPLYIVLYHQVQKKHIETWTISISVGILQPSILSGDSYMYNNTASILIPR